MIATHLPALQVVIPLLAAPLCVLLRRGGLCWALTLAVSWAVLAIALALLGQVLEGGTLFYPIGDWAAPWGIEYRLDALGGLVLVIVAAIGAVVLVFARRSVAHEIPEDRVYLFYALYLLCLTGLLGIVITGDAFNLFVFLEIFSLAAYALVSMGRGRRALTAAFQYLVMGTIGATFYVIGVALMYMMTGTLNMADLAARLPAVAETRTILAALAFITVGISLKLALFPLHLWLPNAYSYAPSMVSAFLAATATKVAVYVLLRMFFSVFGAAYVFEAMPVRGILMTLALLAMFAASTVAIFQDDVKRMLAYSSVAQIGYIVLGIAFASVTGLTGGIVHLFNHAVTKGALFLVLGCVFLRTGSVMLDDMAGLGRRMPLTMAAFVVGGLSLIGIPFTVGFISKWYLVLAALEAGWWPVAVLVVLASMLAVVYVWRVVEVVYFRPAPAARSGADGARDPALDMLVPTWILIAATVYFGVDSTASTGVAGRAASLLLGAG
ncbi:MAG: monovalent cation/H+ antiporter subunit D family protein [Kiloniellales bacterium]